MADLERSIDTSGEIHIDTFGKFRVYNTRGSDKHFRSSSEKQCKLFEFMLVNSNRSLSIETIIENVCPENKYSDVKNTLQNNIYRLRKSLKECRIFDEPKKWLTYDSGCYTLKIDERFDIDFVRFEREVVMGCGDCSNCEKSIESLEKACSIYRGEFLPNLVSEDWAIFKRNHFSRLYIKSIKELADRYFSKSRYDEATKLCENALNYEPYEEEIHVKLIDSFIKKGNYRAAKKHYNYVTKLFYEQFNISPSEGMQLAYRDIKERTGNGWHTENRKNEDVPGEDKCGAHYCSIEELSTVYSVLKKRERRTGKFNIPVLFSYSGDFDKIDRLKIRKILISSLREGDLVSRLGDDKYIVYLVESELKTTKSVLERIIRRMRSNKELNKGIFTINKYYI